MRPRLACSVPTGTLELHTKQVISEILTVIAISHRITLNHIYLNHTL